MFVCNQDIYLLQGCQLAVFHSALFVWFARGKTKSLLQFSSICKSVMPFNDIKFISKGYWDNLAYIDEKATSCQECQTIPLRCLINAEINDQSCIYDEDFSTFLEGGFVHKYFTCSFLLISVNSILYMWLITAFYLSKTKETKSQGMWKQYTYTYTHPITP